MKKTLLLFLVAMLGLTMSAQDIKCYMGTGELLESGKTYYFNDIVAEEDGDEYWVEMKPNMYIMCDQDVDEVYVNTNCTSGHEISLCCGGNCIAGTNLTKEGLSLLADTKFNLDFDLLGSFKEVPENVVTEITIGVKDKAETVKSYTIIMNDKTGAVNVIKNSNAIIFTASSIAYNVDKPGILTIWNTNGQKVIEQRINDNGTISLANLSKGIYIYTLNYDNTLARKIIVK